MSASSQRKFCEPLFFLYPIGHMFKRENNDDRIRSTVVEAAAVPDVVSNTTPSWVPLIEIIDESAE
jgi:hypothetical protein